jgi:predicted Zn-ribbon and HTH transcriptional regulator
MNNTGIQQIFSLSYADFASKHYQTPEQVKAAYSIIDCKTGVLGINVSQCSDCGHIEYHNNSCRNRNCPNCQAVKKEVWVDKRRAEVINSPYFHVVFTLPHELNSLIYSNQRILYSLLHKCSSETLLELSANKKYLGATPGIIQILHTWNQTLDYHVHMHCIISGGGITSDKRIQKSKRNFFIPVHVLRNKFKGKYLYYLNQLYLSDSLCFPKSAQKLKNTSSWNEFRNSLYQKDWCPYIKETFNGFGNAIEYLGRYTHKIAISNSRIIRIANDTVIFSARALRKGEPRRIITLSSTEFIRRFLMHVLPSGFQKIRYYGFLNNRMKSENLRLIFKIQGSQRFKRRYENLSIAELLKMVWKKDITLCPECGRASMKYLGKASSAFG